MRKGFTTTIDDKIQIQFREACKKNKLTMSEVLEVFMTEYSEGRYVLETKKTLNFNNHK